MMKYLLINRKKMKIAKSNEEFINWMRKCDFQRWDSIEDFMEGYSHRKLTFEKIQISTNSIDTFVKDLQDNNILRIEQIKPKILGFFKFLM